MLFKKIQKFNVRFGISLFYLTAYHYKQKGTPSFFFLRKLILQLVKFNPLSTQEVNILFHLISDQGLDTTDFKRGVGKN